MTPVKEDPFCAFDIVTTSGALGHVPACTVTAEVIKVAAQCRSTALPIAGRC